MLPAGAPCPPEMPKWLRRFIEGGPLYSLLLSHHEPGPYAALLYSDGTMVLVDLSSLPKQVWRQVLSSMTTAGVDVAAGRRFTEVAITFCGWMATTERDHPAPPEPKDDPNRKSCFGVIHRRADEDASIYTLVYQEEGARFVVRQPWERIGMFYTPHLDGVLGPLRRPETNHRFVGDPEPEPQLVVDRAAAENAAKEKPE